MADQICDLPRDPDYITYLLDPEQEYNCYFVVGNPSLNIVTERIGVVKKMLLAHSVVLRAELQDSKIAEKDDVRVTDMYPDTFKNMLRFTYGYDNIAVLTFDEADNLLYVAEKYMMVGLKNKLASRLMSMLNCENICILMNNPACSKTLELNSAITEILQTETEGLLNSSQFLNLNPDAFLKILEQEILDVDEIDLWKSAIKWAKNRASSEDGQTLRQELSSHLQHIRVCSFSYETLWTEVFTTDVLTNDELKLVIKSLKSGEVQPSLITVCNTIEDRPRPIIKSDILIADFTKGSTTGNLNQRLHSGLQQISTSVMKLHTKDDDIEICFVEFSRCDATTHKCSGSIVFDDNCGSPITWLFDEQLDILSPWYVPSSKSGMRVRLDSKKSYSVKISFSCGSKHLTQYISGYNDYNCFLNSHLKVDYHKDSRSYYVFHTLRIKYRTLKKKEK